MTQAAQGDKVAVHYTGKLESGETFDSSREREPLEFTIGAGQMIPGFEKGVTGMAAGETKTLTLAPEEAYGERRPELQFQVERTRLPQDMAPEAGMRLQLQQQDGQPFVAVITDVTEESVTLDANSPLAGKTLIFDLEIMKIN